MRPVLKTLITVLLAASLAADGHASDLEVPAGFNAETVPGAGPIVAILADGTVLLSTGSFPDDELSVLHADGTTTLWADGIGSLAGVAQDPISGDVVVGDSLNAPNLRVLRDLNDDGDALDPGEDTAHPAPLPVLDNGGVPLPFALAFRPGTSELYMSGSTHFSISPTLGVIVRITGSTATVWADGLTFGGGLLWDGADLVAADSYLSPTFQFLGRVLTLTDANADGDALDAGESVVFADALPGASGVVQASDGSVYVSGMTDPIDFSGGIARLLPDGDGDGASDGVTDLYFDGFGFAAGMILMEGGVGLVPGAHGDGELFVQDFGVPGWKVLRSAPIAVLGLDGVVANDSAFTLDVAGDPGALPLVVLSLDQTGITLPGLGDLCLGFAQPNIILTLPPIAGGESSVTLALHGVSAAVGLPLTIQAFAVQSGKIGIGNALDVVVGS
ncbi:MAG: hypothetical protein ACYTCU_06635 [Planctomycetota bacterium]|jgi:hypothetical protein